MNKEIFIFTTLNLRIGGQESETALGKINYLARQPHFLALRASPFGRDFRIPKLAGI
jgi:hypothetical protein